MKMSSRLAAVALLASAPLAQVIPPDLLVTELVDGPLGTMDEPSRALVIADFDGDFDLDVYVANLNQGNSLFLNDGSGIFTAVESSAGPVVTDAFNSRGVAAADIDSDGDVDLFVTNSLSQPNNLYVNQGGVQGGTEGDFVATVVGDIVTDIANSRRSCFADIDGDDDLDLFVANFNSQPNDLYVNQGGLQGGVEGDFVAMTEGGIVNDPTTSYACAAADIDGDDDIDIYVTNHDGLAAPSSGDRNVLYENDGAGGFMRKAAGDATTDEGNSLCCGFSDFDGDGDADLFVGNDENDRNRIYRNDGTGNFTAYFGGQLVMQRGESIGCAVADVDLDGDVDLMMANRKGQPNVVYFNDGNGVFESQEFGPLVSNRGDTYDVALGDLDGDTLPEILAANVDERNYTYFNFGRQWENAGSALPGMAGEPRLNSNGNFVPMKDIELSIDNAAPNAATMLVVGFSTVFLPLKGGILVPSPDIMVSTSTDAQGEFEVVAQTPMGLPFGFEFNFQAWLSDPSATQKFAATNALTVTTP